MTSQMLPGAKCPDEIVMSEATRACTMLGLLLQKRSPRDLGMKTSDGGRHQHLINDHKHGRM